MTNPLLRRTAQPRTDFIGDAPKQEETRESLPEILDNYDKASFVRWIESNATNDHLRSLLDELQDEDKLIYTSMLKDCAPQLAKMVRKGGRYGDWRLPYPICPSYLSSEGILSPTEMLILWPVEVLCDEYFGICYQPGREGNGSRSLPRFQTGFKNAIMARIKSEMTATEVIQSDDAGIQSGLSVADPTCVVALFGEPAVEQWWKSVDEGELRQWLEVFVADEKEYWYKFCVDKWGGELTDRPVSENLF